MYQVSCIILYFNLRPFFPVPNPKVNVPGSVMTSDEKSFLVAALVAMNCLPVFLEADIARAAYHGYCKQVFICFSYILYISYLMASSSLILHYPSPPSSYSFFTLLFFFPSFSSSPLRPPSFFLLPLLSPHPFFLPIFPLP